MTPSELKYHHELAEPNCFFFSRDSMKHFGDTMKNYGVRSAKLTVRYDNNGDYLDGEKQIIDVWELYRKKPVKCGVKTSAFFCKTTFKIRHGDLVVD
jgi:hypothetical protein